MVMGVGHTGILKLDRWGSDGVRGGGGVIAWWAAGESHGGRAGPGRAPHPTL